MGLRVAVYNNSGATITEGKILAQTGIIRPQQLPTVTLATATSTTLSPVFGVAFETIPNNAVGSAVISGTYSPLDTTGFNVDDLVYLSDTAGEISASPGTIESIVGVVISVGTSGCVLLKEVNNPESCDLTSGTSTFINTLPSGAVLITQYGTATLVPANSETIITAYMVPVGKQFHLTGYTATADVWGRYAIYINASTALATRSSLAQPAVQQDFEFGEIVATAGQTISIRGTHYDASFVGTFEATLFGYLV